MTRCAGPPSTLRRLLLFVLLAQIAIGGYGIAASATLEGPATGSLGATERRELTAPSAPLTIETGFAFAEPSSREWSDDARLMAASAVITWGRETPQRPPEAPPAAGWITYTFADDEKVFTVFVGRESGGVFQRVGETLRERPVRELTQTTYPISSSTALLSAERLLGTDYRNACPEHRDQSRVGLASDFRSADGSTISTAWVVTYRDNRTSDKIDIRVVVDAQSGEVVASDARGIECADP